MDPQVAVTWTFKVLLGLMLALQGVHCLGEAADLQFADKT